MVRKYLIPVACWLIIPACLGAPGSSAKAKSDRVDQQRHHECLQQAEAGDAHAMATLGTIYAEGSGVPTDLATSFQWFRKAALAGASEAYSNLAFCYATGTGTVANAELAIQWYEKAADLGDFQALFHMALVIENMGGPENEGRAFDLYTKAADLGCADAYNRLGAFWLSGFVVPADAAKAMECFTNAANGGNRDAFFNLALLYERGEGTLEDQSMAVQNYKRAAGLGHRNATVALGFKYSLGEGIPEDLVEGCAWLCIAARLGEPAASKGLNLVKARLSEDQLEASMRRYRQIIQDFKLAAGESTPSGGS